MHLLKVLDLLSEAMEVEIIGDVLLVYFSEELVTFEVTEPLDPAVSAVAVVFVVHGVFLMPKLMIDLCFFVLRFCLL